MVNEICTVGLEVVECLCIYVCVSENILAPWICGYQLGDIRLKSELVPTQYFSPAHSIRTKCVEL